jgi:hypothetical protein
MLVIRLAIPLLFLATAAQAQTPNPNSYLVHPNLAAALARSASQCAVLGCDGIGTKYWWNVIPLTDGTAAIEIQPSGPFGETHTNPHGTHGLNAVEHAALKPAATITPLMPAKP